MSPTVVFLIVSIPLTLAADGILVGLGFLSISTTVRGWGLATTVVPILGGALGGHLWHDLVKSVGLAPIPAHFMFFWSILLIAGITQAMRAAGHPPPMELLAAVGWCAAAATVPT